MTSRRDWQLQQLGIIRWSLRRPALFTGEIAFVLPASTRLLIITDVPLALNEPLVGDVLHSLNLTAGQVTVLTPERAAMLPEGARCNSWWLGCRADATLTGRQLHSPTLADLADNGAHRRALWQQICDYEDDFFTHGQ